MKKVVLTGIDASGKTSIAKYVKEKLPNTVIRKYPNDVELKTHINNYYDRLVNADKNLHEEAIMNIYKQVHDLYDRDFRMPFAVPEGTELLLFDRYFIDNVVYSRMNGVEKSTYSESQLIIPDMVIMLKCRDYIGYKKTFKLKGDENIREPAVLFHETQPVFQTVLKELHEQRKIKRYTIVEALTPNTNENIVEIIKAL